MIGWVVEIGGFCRTDGQKCYIKYFPTFNKNSCFIQNGMFEIFDSPKFILGYLDDFYLMVT